MAEPNKNKSLSLIGHKSKVYLEYLRNLTPQVLLIVICELIYKAQEAKHWESMWVTIFLSVLAIATFVAFIINALSFIQDFVRDDVEWVAKIEQAFNDQNIFGTKRNIKFFIAIWREKVLTLLAIITFTFLFPVVFAGQILVGHYQAESVSKALKPNYSCQQTQAK